MDALCRDKLAVSSSLVHTGFFGRGSTCLYNDSRSRDPWTISGDVSAARTLSITVILGALSSLARYSLTRLFFRFRVVRRQRRVSLALSCMLCTHTVPNSTLLYSIFVP
ncbi:hypothetical protein R3P38DRAFT_2929396 [Favolaschia claudopus]|uniref:Uncharacterized protein n=1 Tax=Favolaschia claudopus TaxID=2862362 RepID=A0AAW0BVR7_9AGAR